MVRRRGFSGRSVFGIGTCGSYEMLGVGTMQLRQRRDQCRGLCLDLPRRMVRLFLGIVQPMGLCEHCHTLSLSPVKGKTYIEILAFAVEQHI